MRCFCAARVTGVPLRLAPVGCRGLFLLAHRDQLHVEDQGTVRQRATVAVGELLRNEELDLAALLDELKTLGPALDDAVQREGRRLPRE